MKIKKSNKAGGFMLIILGSNSLYKLLPKIDVSSIQNHQLQYVAACVVIILFGLYAVISKKGKFPEQP